MSARYRLFEVSVSGHSEQAGATYSALTRSKAMYQAWIDYRDPFPCTFREFMKRATVRLRASPLKADGYDYVRRNYGVDPKIGQRVRLKDEGPSTGLEGEVVYPGPSTAHVSVIIDGRDYAVSVHPLNVELLP